MAVGIRLHHPVLRAPANGVLTYVVELEKEWAARRPRLCLHCSERQQDGTVIRRVEHDRKAVHLKIDSNGDTVVSTDVLEKLRSVFMAGFEVANEIVNPPTQYIGAIDQPQLLVVENRLNADQNPEPVYRPALTQYQSRDRLHRALARSIGKFLRAMKGEQHG